MTAMPAGHGKFWRKLHSCTSKMVAASLMTSEACAGLARSESSSSTICGLSLRAVMADDGSRTDMRFGFLSASFFLAASPCTDSTISFWPSKPNSIAPNTVLASFWLSNGYVVLAISQSSRQ